MTAVDVVVLVPQCMGCAYSEARATETSMPLPDVGPDFASGYAALGFSRRQVQTVRSALRDGSWAPRCYFWCGSMIDVPGEGFRVQRTGILEYFGIGTHDGRKPPQWMKAAVLRGFGGKCAGCKKRLTTDQCRFDHVVPASKGGLTEITNLQVLYPCNEAKADQDVEVEEVVLTFPLRPPPSDGFEEAIW